MIAEKSTAWACLSKADYRSLIRLDRSGIDTTPAAVDKETHETVAALWASGLLAVDGKTVESLQPPSRSVPSSLLLKLTGTCNFACTYCYDYDEERFTRQLNLPRITETISYLLDQRDDLTIAFHGGEPLLRFALIRQVVEYAEAVSRGRGKHVRYAIQTNGSRFNPEVLQFLVEHEFSVGISLDGASEAANTLRPSRKGRSAFQYVTELVQRHPDFVRERCGFLAVISSVSLPHIHEFARWLQDIGVTGLSFSFLDEAGAAKHGDDHRVRPEEAVDMLERFDELIAAREIWDLQLKSLLSRIDNIFRLVPKDFCHKGPCAAADDFLVLDAEGRFRTCDCVYDPFFEIPEADRDWQAVSFSPARQRIIERHAWLGMSGDCRSCPLYGVCGGTCAAKAIAANGTAQSVDPIECAISTYLYPKLFEDFANDSGSLIPYYRHHHRDGSVGA